jgi:hypothetical protein
MGVALAVTPADANDPIGDPVCADEECVGKMDCATVVGPLCAYRHRVPKDLVTYARSAMASMTAATGLRIRRPCLRWDQVSAG